MPAEVAISAPTAKHFPAPELAVVKRALISGEEVTARLNVAGFKVKLLDQDLRDD